MTEELELDVERLLFGPPSSSQIRLIGVRVSNYRAYRDSAWFPIRPVTLIFGANSSGKSSFMTSFAALRQSLSSSIPALIVRGREADLGGIESVAHSSRPRDDIEIALFFRVQSARRRQGWDSAIDQFISTRKNKVAGIGLRFNADPKQRRTDLPLNAIPLVGIDAYVGDVDNPIVRFAAQEAGPERAPGFSSRQRVEFVPELVQIEHPFWMWFANAYGDALLTLVGRFAAAEGNPTESSRAWTLPGVEAEAGLLDEIAARAASFARDRGTETSYGDYLATLEQPSARPAPFRLDGPKFELNRGDTKALAAICATANLFTTLRTSSWVPVQWGNQSTLVPHPLAELWPPDMPSIHVGSWLAGVGGHTRQAVERIESVTATRPRAERFYLDSPISRESGDRTGERLARLALEEPKEWSRLQSLLSSAGLPFEYQVLRWSSDKAASSIFSVAIRESDGSVRNIVDHGVGLAHLLPVALALLAPQREMLLLEEPESHLHPRLQSVVGSVVAASGISRQAPVVVETHSEHVLRRVLRHVGGSVLPALSSDDLAVIYVVRAGGNSSAHVLEVSEDGLLADSWPAEGAEDGYRELLGQ